MVRVVGNNVTLQKCMFSAGVNFSAVNAGAIQIGVPQPTASLTCLLSSGLWSVMMRIIQLVTQNAVCWIPLPQGPTQSLFMDEFRKPIQCHLASWPYALLGKIHNKLNDGFLAPVSRTTIALNLL